MILLAPMTSKDDCEENGASGFSSASLSRQLTAQTSQSPFSGPRDVLTLEQTWHRHTRWTALQSFAAPPLSGDESRARSSIQPFLASWLRLSPDDQFRRPLLVGLHRSARVLGPSSSVESLSE